MKNIRKTLSYPRGLIAVIACLTALLLAPAAWSADWSSPLIIPAADFENSGVFPTSDHFVSVDGYTTGVGTNITTMMAGVYLPWFSTITRVEVALWDLGACGGLDHIEADLKSFSLSTVNSTTTHASVAGDGNVNLEIFTDDSITDPIVDNLNSGYFIQVRMCGEFQGFQGVRIYYTE